MTEIQSFAQTGLEIEALHPVMLDAFSDYIVPLQPSEEVYLSLLKTRGFNPKASYVAIENGEIAAFWNVGTRGARRYLISSGTGVAHRGRGYASLVGRAAIQAAKEAKAEGFWLEVIKGNAGAERLYNKLGFRAERDLMCYKLTHPDPIPEAVPVTDYKAAKQAIAAHAKWEPTWQNTDQTISGTRLTCFASDAGGLMLGEGGFVHQIAARDDDAFCRLLAAAAAAADGPLTFINIDASDARLNRVIVDHGAEVFVRQAEMCLRLGGSA